MITVVLTRDQFDAVVEVIEARLFELGSYIDAYARTNDESDFDSEDINNYCTERAELELALDAFPDVPYIPR